MQLDLKKKAEAVQLVLTKRGINTAPTMRVFAAIDISGSMGYIFNSGAMQKAFDQVLGIAVKFDDNGELDVWAFDDRSYRAPSATAEDYGKYIGESKGKGKFGHWPYGGTQYAPVLQDMVDFGFPNAKPKGIFGFGAKKAPQGDPVMILFFTDGEPGDGNAAERIIKKCSEERTNVYFNLVGIGSARFELLDRLAREYDNCGFTAFSGLDRSDAEVYDDLINDELIAFIKNQGVPA